MGCSCPGLTLGGHMLRLAKTLFSSHWSCRGTEALFLIPFQLRAASGSSLKNGSCPSRKDGAQKWAHIEGLNWINRWWRMCNLLIVASPADGDCSHEIKRHLLLGRKVMTNLDSMLKSRDITLSTKVCLVKAMVFPVVMYGCESWNIKEAERRRTDAFELWCWRRLLRVPWTARRSNQSILKEISPGCSLEGLMLKLKLQYFGHLMRRTDLLEKILMLGKIEGGRRRGWQRMKWLDGITDSVDMGVGDGLASLACCSPWGCKESDTTEQLNWIELNTRNNPSDHEQ